MKIPRPPGWETNRRIVAGRHLWHRLHLPCPFCALEGRYTAAQYRQALTVVTELLVCAWAVKELLP
jgi:hypothetical protein